MFSISVVAGTGGTGGVAGCDSGTSSGVGSAFASSFGRDCTISGNSSFLSASGFVVC